MSDVPLNWRKKPVVIQAWQIPVPSESTMTYPPWLMDAICTGIVTSRGDGSVGIKTLEGTMNGCVGDWIIRGVKNELYPCKPDVFEATYEPA